MLRIYAVPLKSIVEEEKHCDRVLTVTYKTRLDVMSLVEIKKRITSPNESWKLYRLHASIMIESDGGRDVRFFHDLSREKHGPYSRNLNIQKFMRLSTTSVIKKNMPHRI